MNTLKIEQMKSQIACYDSVNTFLRCSLPVITVNAWRERANLLNAEYLTKVRLSYFLVKFFPVGQPAKIVLCEVDHSSKEVQEVQYFDSVDDALTIFNQYYR